MKPKSIRELDVITFGAYDLVQTRAMVANNIILRELTAQLAELNETMKTIADAQRGKQ